MKFVVSGLLFLGCTSCVFKANQYRPCVDTTDVVKALAWISFGAVESFLAGWVLT